MGGGKRRMPRGMDEAIDGISWMVLKTKAQTDQIRSDLVQMGSDLFDLCSYLNLI